MLAICIRTRGWRLAEVRSVVVHGHPNTIRVDLAVAARVRRLWEWVAVMIGAIRIENLQRSQRRLGGVGFDPVPAPVCQDGG